MKLFLPFFVKFEEDVSILSKEYASDCTIKSLNQQLIIRIIYDESTFSMNDSWQKIRILEYHNILHPKEKSKSIIVSDFFLL